MQRGYAFLRTCTDTYLNFLIFAGVVTLLQFLYFVRIGARFSNACLNVGSFFGLLLLGQALYMYTHKMLVFTYGPAKWLPLQYTNLSGNARCGHGQYEQCNSEFHDDVVRGNNKSDCCVRSLRNDTLFACDTFIYILFEIVFFTILTHRAGQSFK